MRTPAGLRAASAAAGLLALMAVAACGGSTTVSLRSPSQSTISTPSASAGAGATASSAASPSASPSTGVPTPTPPPSPSTAAFGVLVTQPSGGQYTVTLVAVDGHVVGADTVSAPPLPACGSTAAAVVPYPISTSNSSLYYEEASGAIDRMDYTGHVVRGVAAVDRPTTSTRVTFSVSPNDQVIAGVDEVFTSNGATTTLFTASLGGSRTVIYSESGAYSLWPVGWHAGNIVLAKAPTCTQGGGPLCCGPIEYHVVSPTNAQRLATVGGGLCGVVVGAPSPAGVLCETGAVSYNAVDWQGRPTPINQWISGLNEQAPAYLSPNGRMIAVFQNGLNMFVWQGPQLLLGEYAMTPCGWIDDSHILAGGDSRSQPRVADLGTNQITPISALGDCGGRIPGGL